MFPTSWAAAVSFVNTEKAAIIPLLGPEGPQRLGFPCPSQFNKQFTVVAVQLWFALVASFFHRRRELTTSVAPKTPSPSPYAFAEHKRCLFAGAHPSKTSRRLQPRYYLLSSFYSSFVFCIDNHLKCESTGTFA